MKKYFNKQTLVFVYVMLISLCFGILFILGIINTNLLADESITIKSPKHIISVPIIASYGVNHPCGRLQQLGIISKLKEYENLNPDIHFLVSCFYLKTNTVNITDSKIYIQQKYVSKFLKDNLKNNFIITIDDAAFKYIGAPLSKKHIMVFFSGLNNPLSSYKGTYNPKYISGIQEIVSLEKFNTFITKQPTLNKILILCSSTASITEKGITNNIIKELKRLQLNYQINTFRSSQDLVSFLNLYNQAKDTYWMFITLQRLFDGYTNNILNKREIYQLFHKYNKHNIEIITNFIGVKLFNVSMSDGPNFYKMGYDLANMLVIFINNNFKPINKIIINSKSIITVNYNRFKKIGLENTINDNFDNIEEIY